MPPDLPGLLDMVLWGAVATAVMTGIMQGAQARGISRLSLPFLVGTMFTGNRRSAMVWGFCAYAVGGWLFAFGYFLLFASIGWSGWLAGAAVGLLHGSLLLVTVLPLFPFIHPRMASDFASPAARPVLEPPGFLALNYGRQTPAIMLFAQTAYGALLGGLPELAAG